MYTSTARYRFEFRMFDWAERLVKSLCGERCSFFVGMRADGTLRRIYFARPAEPFGGDKKAMLAESHPVWFFYSPYEELGAGYVEWYGLERAAVERWLGARLDEADFMDVRAIGRRDEWPRAWRVIIG